MAARASFCRIWMQRTAPRLSATMPTCSRCSRRATNASQRGQPSLRSSQTPACPHLEGVADVTVASTFGNSSTIEVYLVLLGHKLMHFASRTAALTAPETPTNVVDVCEAVAGVSAADMTVLDTSGTKHLYRLHLEASRDHWLHVLALGIDHARTHGLMAVTLSDHKYTIIILHSRLMQCQ